MRALLLSLPLLLAPVALAAPPPPAPPAAPAPAAARGLVFVLTTGVEDPMALGNAFRHARVAKESGHLAEITVVVYARGIQVFDTSIEATAAAHKELEAARAAGVRVVACENAISKWGIPREVVAAQAELVPQGIVEVARLVAAGHEVLSY